jgi:hypothetical protein
MKEKSKIVFVTKYALTEGITKEKVHETDSPTMVETSGCYMTSYYHKPDWHNTEAEARERTAVMIKKKIASVQKQLDRLQKLDAKTMPIVDKRQEGKPLIVGPE